jgi:hypothetical protein
VDPQLKAARIDDIEPDAGPTFGKYRRFLTFPSPLARCFLNSNFYL